nr:MAG TPA: hypothetical protein [Caudoviricetes sp.]
MSKWSFHLIRLCKIKKSPNFKKGHHFRNLEQIW